MFRLKWIYMSVDFPPFLGNHTITSWYSILCYNLVNFFLEILLYFLASSDYMNFTRLE